MNTPLLASFLLMFYPLVVDSATSKEIKLEKTLKDILDKIYTLALEGKSYEVGPYYTENCIIINQGVPPLIGRREVVDHYRSENSTTVKKMNVFMDKIYDKGDLVVLLYHVTAHAADCSLLFTTRLNMVWLKIKGKYLIHNLVSNYRESLCPSTS